jgi:hypothetical protein
VGLVDGLELGSNTIEVVANGQGRGRPTASLEVVNHSISGPVFSGPHTSPFICRTVAAGLGAPLERSIYRWAVLADGGETGNGWSGGLVYTLGGGCGTNYHQGTLSEASVLDHAALSRGFAVASASLNTFGTACNDVRSAETALMVKERAIEELGAAPVWTMGTGGSGGAIQQLLIAHNFPAIGCDAAVPVALRYHPVNNPTGARCTTWDSMVNVWGRDPDTGFARRTFDNVGVQYGLGALQSGAIDVDTFLDLSERIGGYDSDGNRVAARSVADRTAVSIGYASGRVALDGALSDVPILDVRPHTDATGDFHTYSHSFVVRERLREAFGHADNQVMWRAGGPGVAAMSAGALDIMADWLDAIVADDTGRDRAEVVVDTRPAAAVDTCWTPMGERIEEEAEYGVFGQCESLYPPGATPRLVAGAPLDSAVLVCALKPIDVDEYGVALSDEQLERLGAIFPDGVCDHTQPGVGQVPFEGVWQRF